ncbi:MAG: UbiD family decarboxylase [Atopobiaceae bacterium]|nr:UbiD family decarboxylase [Atopobiaceae bacterium]MBQ3282912.1 UbiD family decarboxylase [Atopobiaceae bacterium]MBQ6410496.1 UbiD family decarboxylase [Atopobiaceae bacterium]MBR3384007.1 UbiD family decarboxylase [Atopobiaceae bacterium]MCR4871326.1 UbiD family decarboxylase [Atopobiaceae bacterium]
MANKVFQDFRGYLKALEEEGQLVHITDEVLPEPDIGSAGRAASRMTNGPAVMFDNIKGYGPGHSVVTNAHGSWANHAIMMGMPKTATTKEQFFELNRRWDLYPVAPNIVSREDAPCKENTIDGAENVNLFELLPLYRINSQDGGMFIGKPATVTGDPSDPGNFGKMNIGTYRIQVKGKNRIGMQCLAMHDIAKQLWEAEKKNEKFPFAIALGNAPLVTFMASTPIAYDQNEYEFVGALNGGVPADIVKSDLYDHLYVPAGSEVILEGYIEPRLRTCEGPFGEFPGSYSGCRAQCEGVITHVTYRTNPIFENIYLGMPWTEIDYLMALNTSVPMYKQLHDEGFPQVVAVNAMYTHGMTEIISLKPRYGGHATGAAFKLLSTPHAMPYAHNVIVVDDFVDPFDLNQVIWALSTRVRPDKDVKVIQNCAGMPLNPTEEVPGITAKLIIDATTPIAPEPQKRSVELLEDPAKSAEYAKIIADLMAANK